MRAAYNIFQTTVQVVAVLLGFGYFYLVGDKVSGVFYICLAILLNMTEEKS
jgi:hypothetical protein